MIILNNEYTDIVESFNAYITVIFNHYNGSINIFNKAILTIDWSSHYNEPTLMGYSKVPNKVFINPKVIIDNCYNDHEVLTNIIITIIHELYHTDQVLYYSRLANKDINYVNYIESAVEIQTYMYILNNINEIRELFGLDLSICEDQLKERLNSFTYIPYVRRKFYDHILICLEEIIPNGLEMMQHIFNLMAPHCKHKKGKFTLKINEYEFVIYDNQYMCSINAFNAFLNATLYKGTVFGYHECKLLQSKDGLDSDLVITAFDSKNIMCTKVRRPI